MEAYTINLYPIFKIFCILFAIVGAYSTINNFLHLLARFGKDKLDNQKDMHAKDCDSDVMQDLIQFMQTKYPDVKKDFILLKENEKSIENNQEIHDMNKRMEVLEAELSKIQFLLSRLNVQQSMTYNEIKGNKN